MVIGPFNGRFGRGERFNKLALHDIGCGDKIIIGQCGLIRESRHGVPSLGAVPSAHCQTMPRRSKSSQIFSP